MIVEGQAYVPHIILARCKGNYSEQKTEQKVEKFIAQPFELLPFRVSQFSLYHSHQVDGQLVYFSLRNHPLEEG